MVIGKAEVSSVDFVVHKASFAFSETLHIILYVTALVYVLTDGLI